MAEEPIISDAVPPRGPIQTITRFLRDGCVIEQLSTYHRDIYAIVGNPDKPEFVGEGIVTINGRQGPMQQRFRFKIEAETIETAFDGFQAAADAVVAEMEANHQARLRAEATKIKLPGG